MRITQLFSSLLLAALLLFANSFAHAFDVPSGFEEDEEVGEKFWINPKTMETVSANEEDVSKFKKSKDPLAELTKLQEHKGETLSLILNISDYKIISQKEINSIDGKYVIFMGTYKDSSKKLTHFAEVYELPKDDDAKAFLLTRYKTPWNEQEIFERFKVGK